MVIHSNGEARSRPREPQVPRPRGGKEQVCVRNGQWTQNPKCSEQVGNGMSGSGRRRQEADHTGLWGP